MNTHTNLFDAALEAIHIEETHASLDIPIIMTRSN